MRSIILGLGASLLVASAAAAQTASNPAQGTTTPMTTSPDMGGMTAAPATSGTPAATSNPNSAAGDSNQAVATTNANAMSPAKGHNSFTRGEARRRIRSEGFTHITGLHKDSSGVWRGTGTKDGNATGVWLDYKGNVGTSAS